MYIRIVALSVLFLWGINLNAQEMFQQSQKYHNKWRSTFGVGGPEPMAAHIQLYRGFSCKSLRSWLLEGQVGMEGLLLQTSGKSYNGGTWEGGGLRYSASFNLRMLRFVSDYIPWMGFLGGVGVQGGKRYFLDENQKKNSVYALGPIANFNMEMYVLDRRISKTDYLGVLLFAEYIYHSDVSYEFEISRINGGLRLNFYN